MAETALAEAFERVGINRPEMEFHAAVTRYFKAGGSEARAHELVTQAANKLLSGSQSGLAVNGLPSIAAAQQPDGDAGAKAEAPDGHPTPSPASPLRSATIIQHGYRGIDGTFRQKPQTSGGIAAAARAARSAAMTVLDSFKVRDGRAIGDIHMNELPGLRARNIMEAAIFQQIRNHVQYDPSTNPRVRDLVKVADMERFVQRGAEVADAS